MYSSKWSIKKTLCLILLSALLLLSVGMSFYVDRQRAHADNITTTSLSDDIFEFVPGAATHARLIDQGSDNYDLTTARARLRFQFKLKNFAYENLRSQIQHYSTWWGREAINVFAYEFTLYKGNNDGDGAGNLGTADPQYSVLVVIYPNENKQFEGYIAKKTYYTNSYLQVYNHNIGSSNFNADEKFLRGTDIFYTSTYNEYDYIAKKGMTFDISGGNYNGTTQEFGKNYSIVDRFSLTNNNLNFSGDSGNGLILNIIANLNSPFQYYFINARYCFSTTTYAGMFSTDRTSIYGNIYSSSRSVANVLQRMEAAGDVDIDTFFGFYANVAHDILRVDATRRVRIKYLTEIEGTPYATHNYAYVDVPVLSETIYIDDVEEALGISLNKCLDSNAYCFQKTTDTDGELYQLYYLKNVWLRSATVDGHFFDYFLDINDSYKEIYRPYVEAEILSNDVYEWIYSTQIVNKFPALSNYRFNEIYGYFGLVVVPETYTLNSALKTLFDVQTSKIGVISTFSFERMLPYSGYQRLLSEYNYGFLSKAWSEVTGFVSGSEHQATYYVVYSEPGTENALIGEGGQTDIENPGSIVENEVIKPIGGIISNVWDGIIGFFTGISSNFKLILWIALGVVVLIIIFKYKNRSKRK